MSRGPGRIILLGGASSSGKSTLAAALQAAMDEPFLHVFADQFVAADMLPQRRENHGPFDWWRQVCARFFVWLPPVPARTGRGRQRPDR
jgi:chloramphenicol 3-O phosphotransferase